MLVTKRKMPLRLPVAFGVKRTVAVQDWPAASVVVLVQVPPVFWKSAWFVLQLETTALLIVRSPPLWLVIVSVVDADACPTTTEPKPTLVGASTGVGTAVPEPVPVRVVST